MADPTCRRLPLGHPDKRCKGCGAADGLDWWVGRYTCTGPFQARCHACFLEYMRAKYHRSKRPRLTGQTVACMICSVPFTRTKGHAHCCSPECSAEAQRNKNRREGVKRRGADKGVPYTLLEVAADSHFMCHLCGELVDMALPRTHRQGATVDHVVPISLGGLDCATNVKLAHKSCNSRRGNRDVDSRSSLRLGSDC